ncbi:MAG: hypothetical protein CMC86_05450 [Flavobacteriaceae bacterium]|nr:hypothetical protein [Flavobacteriaceae bacterium]|tara:strand:- start:35774 stop:36904 length:1131 start_codon:yes stop_codon:yes gene_type:complete
MKGNQNNTNNITAENSIDIIHLVINIWNERKLVSIVTMSFFIIGCFVALLSPVVYTSQTTFVPQVSGGDEMSSANNRLGSLASLAGININQTEMKSDSYLSPLVYTNIIDSEEFSLKLLDEELINLNADKFTIKEYLLSKESSFNFDPIGFIKKYTIGLFVDNETNIINSDVLENYNFISKVDYSLIKSFRQKFNIELNEKLGYIRVLAFDENAFISSQIVEQTTKSLQSKIIEIRTNKIKERLEFSKEQYELKQAEFDILQKKLAEFKDSNKNISTATFMSQLQKLESEYQLQQNILINLAAEYNNNKIKLNKDTPIFSVIDEVSVPNERSEPNRSIIVFSYVFLGFALSVGFIVVKNSLIKFINEIKDYIFIKK